MPRPTPEPLLLNYGSKPLIYSNDGYIHPLASVVLCKAGQCSPPFSTDAMECLV